MAIRAGTAFVEILPKLDKLKAELNKSLSGLSQRLGNTGKTLTRNVTLPMVGLGVASLKAFTDAEEATAKLQAVLKSTKGVANVSEEAATALASQLQKVTTFDDEAILGLESLLLTFTNVRNEVGKGNDIFNQTVKVGADMSQALGQDLKSSAIQLGKALNDPVKGVTALSRVGVSFTEQQKAQIKTLIKSGDTLGAQKLILKELNKEFGGTAKAVGKTAGGQMKRAMNQLGDAAESVGEILLPVIQKLTEWVNKLVGWFRQLSPEGKKMVVTIAAIAAAVGPALIVVSKMVSAFAAVGKAFSALSKLMSANPWALLILATVALVILVIKNWDKVKAGLKVIWDAIKKAASKVWQAIRLVIVEPVKAVGRFIGRVWTGIKTITSTVWNGIKDFFFRFTLFGFIIRNFDKIKRVIVGIWQRIKQVTASVWDGIKDVIRGAINFIIGNINRFIRGVNDSAIRAVNILNPLKDVPKIPEIPTLRTGGLVLETGLAVVHEGEQFSGVPSRAEAAEQKKPLLDAAAIEKAFENALRRAKLRTEILGGRTLDRLLGSTAFDFGRI